MRKKELGFEQLSAERYRYDLGLVSTQGGKRHLLILRQKKSLILPTHAGPLQNEDIPWRKTNEIESPPA